MATFLTIPEEGDKDAPGAGPMTPEERAEWKAFSEAIINRPWRPRPNLGSVGFNTIEK